MFSDLSEKIIQKEQMILEECVSEETKDHITLVRSIG